MLASSTDFKTLSRYLSQNGISSKSVSFYLSDIRVFIKWLHKSGEAELSKESFESYEYFLKNAGLPTKTINRKLSSLRKFNDYLVSKKLIKTNVMKKVRNQSKDRHVTYVHLSKLAARLFPSREAYLFVILFGVIVLLGSLLLNSNNTKSPENLTTDNTKFAVPLVIQVGSNEDYEKNLSKLAQSQNSLVNLLNDPSLTTPNGKTYVGRSEIAASQTEQVIYTSSVTQSSYVFITPLANLNGNNLFIKQVNDGFFIVSLEKPMSTSISFNWMIVIDQLTIDTRH